MNVHGLACLHDYRKQMDWIKGQQHFNTAINERHVHSTNKIKFQNTLTTALTRLCKDMKVVQITM